MTERAMVGAGDAEMGNQSTGTESVVSIALASPFDERNIPTPSIIAQRLKLVHLNGETRIHRLKRKDQSSTGTPDAGKVARPVWMRGKTERSYLCIRNVARGFDCFHVGLG
jgi:hypothetical protein